jgi:hypothetical protein
MKKTNIVITLIITLFILLACLQVTGVLAAEPTSTPWPVTTDNPDCPRPTRTPTPTMPPSDVGVTEFTAESDSAWEEFLLGILIGVAIVWIVWLGYEFINLNKTLKR